MENKSPSETPQQIVADWVKEYTETLYSWAFRHINQKETSEDLVQETFIAALEKYHSFRNESSPKTWLMSILKNKIADYYRKFYRENTKASSRENEIVLNKYFDEDGAWRTEEAPQEWSFNEKNLLDDLDFQNVLRNCLSLLPKKWLIVVQQKFLLQKSADEICDNLDIATTNYWQMVHRAKLQLRKCVELKWFKN